LRHGEALALDSQRSTQPQPDDDHGGFVVSRVEKLFDSEAEGAGMAETDGPRRASFGAKSA
jgi:hypothetical protein